MDTVAATVAEPAELLDVKVDQLAGRGTLVAADDPAAWPVHDGQAVEPEADQHPIDGGGRPADQRRDPGRAELAAAAQPADLGLDAGGDLAGVGVGGAGPVVQAGLAQLLVAGPPAVGAGAGDAHLAGGVGDGTASGDALAQQQPSRWVRRALAWTTRDLQVVGAVRQSQPRSEVPPCVNTPVVSTPSRRRWFGRPRPRPASCRRERPSPRRSSAGPEAPAPQGRPAGCCDHARGRAGARPGAP